MSPLEVLQFYKSYHYFSLETGMSASTLWNWCSWGYVPMRSQVRLELLTLGALKADSVDGKDVNYPKENYFNSRKKVILQSKIDRLKATQMKLQAKLELLSNSVLNAEKQHQLSDKGRDE